MKDQIADITSDIVTRGMKDRGRVRESVKERVGENERNHGNTQIGVSRIRTLEPLRSRSSAVIPSICEAQIMYA